MNIKTKLTYGIGLLFVLITLLGGLAIKNIHNVSDDTQNILADNYNSLLYSRQMLESLDAIRENPNARKEFEAGLEAQKKNLTEKDEDVLTNRLSSNCEKALDDMDDESIRQIRQTIYTIMAVNMSAIYEKNEVAVHTAERSLFWIWTVGIACIVIAFLFLARLPRSVSVQIQKLTDGIKEITNANYSKRLNLGNEPEFKEIATLFNEMAERLAEYRNSSLEDILQGKKYIETIINSIAEPIIGLSKERKILFVNDEALTVLNLTRENIIDKPAPEVALKNDLLRRLIRQLVHPDDNKDPLKIYADNKESYFQVKYIPINVNRQTGLESKYVGDVILLKNVTEFKEKDIAKTTFISTISHELKTPLSGLRILLENMQYNIGKYKDRDKYLAEAVAKVDELSGMVRDILDTSKVQDLQEEEKQKLYAGGEIGAVLQEYTMQIADKKLEVSDSIPEECMLFMSRNAFQKVWSNLIGNAVQYTEQGGQITIAADTDKIWIENSCTPLTEEQLAYIYEPFYRVDDTRAASGGNGLGLYVVRELLKKEGFRYVFEPVEDGMRFTIFL